MTIKAILSTSVLKLYLSSGIASSIIGQKKSTDNKN